MLLCPVRLTLPQGLESHAARAEQLQQRLQHAESELGDTLALVARLQDGALA